MTPSIWDSVLLLLNDSPGLGLLVDDDNKLYNGMMAASSEKKSPPSGIPITGGKGRTVGTRKRDKTQIVGQNDEHVVPLELLLICRSDRHIHHIYGTTATTWKPIIPEPTPCKLRGRKLLEMYI